jgi:hypothetical protein
MDPNLNHYVLAHAIRGACQCGRCIDAPSDPEKHQPTGHTADVHFFNVAATNGATADTLRAAIQAHGSAGEFTTCNPFDGAEHSYIELGAWLGDQGTALMLMGLGKVLGLWELMTPRSMMPGLPAHMLDGLAKRGYVAIQAKT